MSRHTIAVVVASAVLSSGLSVTAIQVLNPPMAAGSPQASASVSASVKTVRELQSIDVVTKDELKALKKLDKTLVNGFADLHTQTGATNTKLDAANTELQGIGVKTEGTRRSLASSYPEIVEGGGNVWFKLHTICITLRNSSSC